MSSQLHYVSICSFFNLIRSAATTKVYIVTTGDVLFCHFFFRSVAFFPHNNIVGKNSAFGTLLDGTYYLFDIMLNWIWKCLNFELGIICHKKFSQYFLTELMDGGKEGRKKTQFQQPFNTLLATKALVTMSVLFFLDLPRSISNAGISVQAEPSNITLAAAVEAQWPKKRKKY